MNAAVELHAHPSTENHELARLAYAIEERQRHADEARRTIKGIEHALAELAPAVRRQEILVSAGFPANPRGVHDHANLEARLSRERETAAGWAAQIAELSARADAIPLSPLDTVAAKLLRKKPEELQRAERGVSLVLPEGHKAARLRLFSGRELEF